MIVLEFMGLETTVSKSGSWALSLENLAWCLGFVCPCLFWALNLVFQVLRLRLRSGYFNLDGMVWRTVSKVLNWVSWNQGSGIRVLISGAWKRGFGIELKKLESWNQGVISIQLTRWCSKWQLSNINRVPALNLFTNRWHYLFAWPLFFNSKNWKPIIVKGCDLWWLV